MTQKIFRRLVEGKSVETDAAGQFRACFATFKVARDDHQFLDGAFVKNWKGLGKDGTTDFKRSGSPLLRGHDMEHNSVGRVEGLTETSEGLFGDAVFAPTPAGRELAQLYKGGWQCSFSVSWAPAEWTYATGKGRAAGAVDFKRVELIEISAVPVPADVNAVVQRAQRGDLDGAARTLGVKLAISEVEPHVQRSQFARRRGSCEPTLTRAASPIAPRFLHSRKARSTDCAENEGFTRVMVACEGVGEGRGVVFTVRRPAASQDGDR